MVGTDRPYFGRSVTFMKIVTRPGVSRGPGSDRPERYPLSSPRSQRCCRASGRRSGVRRPRIPRRGMHQHADDVMDFYFQLITAGRRAVRAASGTRAGFLSRGSSSPSRRQACPTVPEPPCPLRPHQTAGQGARRDRPELTRRFRHGSLVVTTRWGRRTGPTTQPHPHTKRPLPPRAEARRRHRSSRLALPLFTVGLAALHGWPVAPPALHD
jgi:hypothetical protein